MATFGHPAIVILGMLALLAVAQPASANLCVLLAPGQRAVDEAEAVRGEFGVVLPDDPATTTVDESARLDPRRDYNARLIHCNRQRNSNGEDIAAAIAADHVFPGDLEPRTVKGHYRYGPGFNLRYAYQAGLWPFWSWRDGAGPAYGHRADGGVSSKLIRSISPFATAVR